ncbi:MAG TPA: alpha/beta hydrolase [Steroidobacter sp.]|jgi:pimeloyl-ACP methyl ester carboxylesterase|nr:alpha/beta hydrolase [Steroidobacter sp.]
MYQARRPARRETLLLRGLKFNLYRWGGSGRPIVFVHGWGDTAETWQFVIDHLPATRSCVALDMRGFGRTQRPPDGYWFPDYLADLEAALDQIAPGVAVDLVGHSMGGNIVMLYAGVRAQRVRRLVNLEGFGMPRTTPEQAPARYAEWLDEIRSLTPFASYDDYEQFIRVLGRRNPGTPPDRLEFIARSWAHETAQGRIELWADPRHKRVNPVLYQRDQAEACWREITAPALFVIGGESDLAKRMSEEIREPRLRELFPRITPVTIEGAGHMLHHERPEEVARLIDEFLGSEPLNGEDSTAQER